MEEQELISVIIPSYNRFKFLLRAIQSIRSQTYKNIEIIVVNDGSDKEREKYHSYDWEKNGIKIIHLETNSKEIFGYPCVGYVRNFGILDKISNSANSANAKSAKYCAFLDDDDQFIFPQKLELQIAAMKRTGCKMSSTEALFGYGEYDSNKTYSKYNAEAHIDILKNVYKDTTYLDDGFPEIWTKDFLKIHNCVICSSVVIDRSLLNNINNMRHISIAALIPEDYDCWLRATEYTDCVYIKEPCVYYDGDHGYGLNR